MAEYRLNVNGTDRRVTAEPDTPLLWVLRDEMGLTGTKFGCGIAQCGACVVEIDGAPVRSCVMRVSNASKTKIRTIESLHLDPDGQRLQDAAFNLTGKRFRRLPIGRIETTR